MTRALSMATVAAVALTLGASAAEAGRKKTVTVITGVLNLNTANARELEKLPGVGEKAAMKIIAYREKAKFTRIEDLVKVKGFGKKRFEKLKAHLTVTGPTTLAVKKVKQEGGGATQARREPPKR
ncbi:MAG: ComEA family DNA-binding protein [Myxococcota bacterium]